ICFESFDCRLVRINRKNFEAAFAVSAHGFVPEFSSVARCADDCYAAFWHDLFVNWRDTNAALKKKQGIEKSGDVVCELNSRGRLDAIRPACDHRAQVYFA